MAAFSYQHQPAAFYLDPSCVTNVTSTSTATPSIKNLSGFMEEAAAANLVVNPNCFSQFYPLEVPLHGGSTNPPPPPPLDVNLQGSCHVLDQTSCKAAHSGSTTATQPSSVTKNQQSSRESSTVVDNPESGEQVTQMVMIPMDKKRKNKNNGSSLNSSQSKDAEEGKSSKRQKKCNATEEVKEEEKKKQPKAEKKDQKRVTEEPPTGYIHVRARRGQATDSHSLAERLRREKISERMKILQGLVPGCDKVTGKALMLDQIINYVQSLQNQIELLSMKLASVNHMFYDYGLMDLGTFMVRPGRLSLSSMAPQQQQLPSVQQCSPTAQPTAFSDATTITTTATATTSTALATAANWSYPTTLHDAATLSLQGQRPCDSIDQDISSLLWDVEEQRQNFLNPSAVGFTTNNLCSFH